MAHQPPQVRRDGKNASVSADTMLGRGLTRLHNYDLSGEHSMPSDQFVRREPSNQPTVEFNLAFFLAFFLPAYVSEISHSVKFSSSNICSATQGQSAMKGLERVR